MHQVFPAPLIEETVFSPLYLYLLYHRLIAHKCLIYFCAFSASLSYVSVFVTAPYFFDLVVL